MLATLPYLLPLWKEDQIKVVDLNCGHCPISKYLPTGVEIICNDTQDQPHLHGQSNVSFKLATDETMVDVLRGTNIDLLCCFGLGGYEISKEAEESKTVTSSLIKLATNNHPSLIVVESIEEFEPLLLAIKDHLSGYKLTQRIAIHLSEPSVVAERVRFRVVYIFQMQYYT